MMRPEELEAFNGCKTISYFHVVYIDKEFDTI